MRAKWLLGICVVMGGFGFMMGGNAQGKDDKGLSPMPNLPFLSPTQLNRPQQYPCQNPGAKPPQSKERSTVTPRDCVARQLLAIFNPTVANFPNAKEGKIDLGSLKKDVLVPFFRQVKGDGKNGQIFTDAELFGLPQAKNLTGATSQVCGQVLVRIELASGVDVNEAARQLRLAVAAAGGSVSFIQPASLYSPQPNGTGAPGADDSTIEPPPTGIVQQWGRAAVNAKPSAGLPSVRVAVLDTGVAAVGNFSRVAPKDVTDLKAITSSQTDDFTGDALTPTGKNGHGTPVASIIANRSGSSFAVQGIAQNASIVPVKVCDNLECLDESVIFGTCYAASAGVEASVLNMSFGGLLDGEILHAAIQDVTRSGSLVVAAAGNTRSDRFAERHDDSRNDDVFPARFSSGVAGKLSNAPFGIMLSVGAVTTKLEYADFSTVNSSVDLAAPGSWVRVLGKSGTTFPGTSLSMSQNYTGTSFSAAFVSGAAAVMIGQSPTSMTPLEVATTLVSNVKPWGTSPDPVCTTGGDCGAGLLQIP